MARLLAASMLVLASILPSGAQAQEEPTDETLSAADEAGVSVVALLGAMNSTGLAGRQYLEMVGELAEPAPELVGAVARADCIIDRESGGLDVYNRQGSGAAGPGQYFQSTWLNHVALYRAATGDTGSLSIHSLADVRRVMALVLSLYPQLRSAWTVGGCP